MNRVSAVPAEVVDAKTSVCREQLRFSVQVEFRDGFVATLVFLATELESTDVSAVPAEVVGAKTPSKRKHAVPAGWLMDRTVSKSHLSHFKERLRLLSAIRFPFCLVARFSDVYDFSVSIERGRYHMRNQRW